MTVNKDMNFELELKRRFDEEAPELPESLKKENVIEMLKKEQAQAKEIKKKKHIFAKILALAAAVVIVATSALVLPVLLPDKPLAQVSPTAEEVIKEEAQELSPEKDEPEYKVIDKGLKATKLMQAESTDEIKSHFLKIYRENKLDNFFDDAFNVFGTAFNGALELTADSAAPQSVAPGTSQAVTSAAAAAPPQGVNNVGTGETAKGEAFGQTNTQVENVDEADVIKNDGRYLYILSGGVYSSVKKVVTVVDTKDMKVMSEIEISEDGYSHYIQEMYINGDRLVLLASESEEIDQKDENSKISYDVAYPYYGKTEKIVSFVYDISDRENPIFIRKVSQDGSSYISSRMIDGVLYTVSTYYVRGDSEKEVEENAVPSVNGENVPCDCIYVYDYDSNSYIVLSAYDTRLNGGEVTSLSILGSGNEVYCSQDALYVAGSNYYNEESVSEIYSFSLNGTEIAYKASGAVRGSFLNQFSLDEYEGNLRVATTYYSYKHDVDVSSIYVLNKKLELIGELEDIAYDEQVKAVRFMGDTGFIVTFRNTDPLFTLDLSDPTAPRVVGEVKLPGFSSYLHPVGEGLVVGIGYDGDEENADFSSLKVSLFDVSDMKNPKEVDTFVLKNVSSSALYNHKAFIFYPEEKLIGFPVEHYDVRTVLSYKLLKIEDRVIENHLGYTHKTERVTGDLFRGTYIGDRLYTIDNYNVCEFDIGTAAMTRECQIRDAKEDVPDEKAYGVVTTPPVMPGGVVATTVSSDENVAVTTTAAVTSAVSQGSVGSVNNDAITTTQVKEYSLEALVIKVLDGSLLVEVTAEGTSSLSVGTQAELSTEIKGIEAGDTVKVIFDGMVEETYPVKIPNVLGLGVAKE